MLSKDSLHRDGPVLGRIVGGSDADIQDYPWQVALMTSQGFQFCGGTVIHPEWILTAAHCLGGTIYIRAGVTNRTHTTGQDRLVIAQYGHPDFNGETYENDIALMRLQTPLDLSGPNVKAIPLATAAHAAMGYTDPTEMSTITGWGRTTEGGATSNILQVAQVPITTLEYAQQAYASFGYIVTPDMIPAGYEGGGVDACQGDSGGPLAIRDPRSPVGYILAGATSWGVGCARPGLPGLYARVSYFETWLGNISGLSFDQPTAPFNPSAFTAEAVALNAIDLSWAGNDAGDQVMIIWSETLEFGYPLDGSSYAPGEGVPGGGTVLYVGAANNFSHTGLEAGTIYYYRAFSINQSLEYSIGRNAIETTPCLPIQTPPLTEDFNATTSIPVCWDVVDHIGNGQVWKFGSFSGGLQGTTGNYAYLNSDGYGSGNSQNSDLLSPVMDFSNYSDINLSFHHYFREFSGSSATLQYTIDGGSTWTTIQQWTSTTANPATFIQILTALDGQPAVQFRWKYTGTWGWHWSVDDVAITGTFMEPAGIAVDLKAALEGAATPGGNPLMDDAINEVLPLQQPFNPSLPYYGNPNPVWLYDGAETAESMPSGVVDWVLLELRDAADAAQANTATVVGRQAALLWQDGSITAINGMPPEFDINPVQNLFAVIYHRNHLPVMSAQPLQLQDGTYSWDFTSGPDQAFGGSNAQKLVASGIYALIGGDGDGNGQIQNQDKNAVWNIQSGQAGYLGGDFDLNGQVQNQDKNNIWNPNSGKGTMVP